MLRLLFSKTGNAVWISHLDTMRLFQRAFKRCGLHLKHTQGFNPRPSVSIAMPLSVGVESECELLDFELDNQELPCQQIKELLNQSLVSGIEVLDVYADGRKIKELELLKCRLELEYDLPAQADAAEQIQKLFERESIFLDKKGKNGMVRQDIIPMIKKLSVCRADDHLLRLDTVICCQNPSLNPNQLGAAIREYLPHLSPDFIKCRRLEVYNGNHEIFR